MKKRKRYILSLVVSAVLLVCLGISTGQTDTLKKIRQDFTLETKLAAPNGTIIEEEPKEEEPKTEETKEEVSSSIPAYSDKAYVVLSNNVPYFSDAEKQRTDSFESYSELDGLGRCSTAFANIGRDLMPTKPRGEIGSVRPSGWHTVKYDNVDGNCLDPSHQSKIDDKGRRPTKYLYNRCHLIGYQLSGENANEKNLITGTRYLNIEGMLPFENMVADYVRETGNHVLYRVVPVYRENDLVARGVRMEAWSVEDQGKGICFNVFCYNVQPGIQIDYATGESWKK